MSLHSRVAIPCSIAMAAVLSLTLAGCGGSSEPSADSDGKVTITVLDSETDEPANSATDALFAHCASNQPGVTIKRVTVPAAEYITKAVQLTASGEAPDILDTDGINVPTLAQAGVLAPIDDLVSSDKINADDYDEGPFSAGSYDGHQYAMPLGNNGEALFYNKTMLEDAGIEPPKTWADLQSAAQELTAGGVYGFAFSMQPGEEATWNWLPSLWSNGGDLDEVNSPEAVEAMEYWTGFVEDGVSPKAQLNLSSADIEPAFVQGKYAMALLGTWTVPGLVKDAEAAGMEWGAVPQPSPDGSPSVTPFGGAVLAVGAKVVTDDAKQQAVFDCLAGLQDSATMVEYADSAGYIPSYHPAATDFLADRPQYQAYADQFASSKSRTGVVGADYAKVSQAISTAISEVATGQKSAQDALDTAQAAVPAS
ncbi:MULTISPECIES: ABC transporter substrate-binding protein [unclassified Nocardioides]|uniref:ABC transporter substrate-binding protein n=1 Tax=unclassified Nocardioides TaxID=2615069 RepID=UPI0013FD6696|nr:MULTISPECIES: ABC transporter substrate-binding protein [unclassified Nocardioides]